MTDWKAVCAELVKAMDAYDPSDRIATGLNLMSTLDRARAVLAQPEPGLVGPTVMEIIELADDIEAAELGQVDFARAVLARWGRPAPAPVAVSERLPEPSAKVLAYYLNDLGKGRTICAIWVPAKTRSDSYGDDDFTEYDEESDTFYWPEGWYEVIENWDDLGYVKVDEGEVIYWQSLPTWPATALPLPAGEVQS